MLLRIYADTRAFGGDETAGLHLLQDVYALRKLRAIHLQRSQLSLQGRDGLVVSVLLMPLPFTIPLVRTPV